MSSFAAKDFNADRYANLRPTYPDSFYQLLNDFHKGRRNLAVDVGCGPGTATFQLADNLSDFQKVIGTDISSAMVQRAKSDKNTLKHDSNLDFAESPGESFEFLGSDANAGKIDMITAAECVHYFDFDKFQQNVSTNLSKDGTWAIWGYGDFFFPDYPKLDEAMDSLIYDDDKLGQFWSQPGRSIAMSLLKDYHFDPKLFTDIREVYFRKEDLKKNKKEIGDAGYVSSVSSVPIYMDKTLTLKDVQEYVKTWSGYHAWQKNNPGVREIAEWFTEQAKNLYPELSDGSELKIVWSTYYKIGRRV